MVAASGSPIRLSRAATLDFDISDSAITHCFYIVDSLPIDQPLILGMDFLVRNHARIDIVKGELVIAPPSENGLQCYLSNSLKLRPGQTVRVTLIAQEGMQGTATGFLRGSDNLPDGCIVCMGCRKERTTKS